MWIAYEGEMTPYPLDVLHDANEFVTIIRQMETNRNLAKDEAKLINARMWFWLAILGALGLLAYFGFQNGWFTQIFG